MILCPLKWCPVLPFQLVLPGWAGSWCWRARDAAPPGLTMCPVGFVTAARPSAAGHELWFAQPVLQPTHVVSSRQPLHTSSSVLFHLLTDVSKLFLMFAKHAASFKQTTEPKQKKTHSSFSWPDPNNIYNTSPIWTCEICLPATRKKTPKHSFWKTVVKMRYSTARLCISCPCLHSWVSRFWISPLHSWLSNELQLKSFWSLECVF